MKTMPPVVRLQKILADRGLASRRKAEDLIREGRVSINGQTARIGEKADPDRDIIRVDGQRIAPSPEKVYVLFNKPKSVVTTLADPEGRTTVMDMVKLPKVHLFPVGRLDYDAEGVLLLTNDGDFAHRLSHPSYEIPRTYWVKLQGKPQKEELQKLSRGVLLEDGPTAPCRIHPLRETEGNQWVEMTLHEGRNRQVKRMWEKLGYHVLKLKRVSFSGLQAVGMKPGDFRILRPPEVQRLKSQISFSAQKRKISKPGPSVNRKNKGGEDE
jgi:23S rRNA pseudouridine2605 synthase